MNQSFCVLLVLQVPHGPRRSPGSLRQSTGMTQPLIVTFAYLLAQDRLEGEARAVCCCCEDDGSRPPDGNYGRAFVVLIWLSVVMVRVAHFFICENYYEFVDK